MKKPIKVLIIGLSVCALGCTKQALVTTNTNPESQVAQAGLYSNSRDLIQAASPELYKKLFVNQHEIETSNVEQWTGVFKIVCGTNLPEGSPDFNQTNCCLTVKGLCAVIVHAGGATHGAYHIGNSTGNDFLITNVVPQTIKGVSSMPVFPNQINTPGLPPMFKGTATNVSTDASGNTQTGDFIVDKNAQNQ